jgi:NADH-quinone oxidoreductase subunit J
MTVIYYLAAAIAVIATAMVITRTNAVHALLYMIVSLLSLALIFFTLGAPFVAALEVIIYAGAIVVLFVFVIMMLNLGAEATAREQQWLQPRAWRGPAVLCAILFVEFLVLLVVEPGQAGAPAAVGVKRVGAALYGPYVLGVELAAMLLLAGLVGAFHLGRRVPSDGEEDDA